MVGPSHAPLRFHRFALFACALVCANVPATVRAQAPQTPLKAPMFRSVRAGTEGFYKLGCWTPVTVGIEASDKSQSAMLVFSVADSDGVPCDYPPIPVQLLGGRVTSATGYVRFGNAEVTLEAKLLTEHDGLISEKFQTDSFDERPHLDYPVPLGERLVFCVGRSSTLRQVAEASSRGERAKKVRVAQVDDVLRLPTRAMGYEGVDAVVLAADKLGRYAALTSDSAQAAALREYVQFGGRVIVVCGTDARQLLGARGPLADVAGLKLGDAVPLPRTAALEEYVGGNKPLRIPARSLTQLSIPRADAPAGVVELAEGDLPLIVRQAVGFGSIAWVTLDLEHGVLADWPGRPLLLAKTMNAALGGAATDGQINSAPQTIYASNYGYNDLAGQLHQAVDQFAGVRVVPFFALALLVITYIALIGPGDYLLVRRLFKRTELTWLTFPVIVVVTSTAAYFAAVALKGDQLRANQADVVDCDAELGLVRGRTFAGVFSPVSQTYDIRVDMPAKLLPGKLTADRLTTTWFGAPGEGLGGMHRRDMASSWFSTGYQTSADLSMLEGAPIKVWSSKLFLGAWQAHTDAKLHAELTEGADGELTGTLTNPFRIALEPSLLCYGSRAVKVPALAPGESKNLKDLESRDLTGLLANAEIMMRKQRELSPGVRTQIHDVSSQDPGEILMKMMFYQSLGGAEHARLANDELTQLDFSELLKLRRAILVAPLGTTGSEAEQAAEPRLVVAVGGADIAREHDLHRTIVRLSIPVRRDVKTEGK
ncbi:MAG: hypothetical protein C0483_17030 [Pirellula sp.]|nr:hypothetical protein [Pirellula sp.]